MDDRPALLLIAQSARALASAAARAGYAPISVDFFADDDTRALGTAERYAAGFRCGFRRALLLPAIERAVAVAGREPEAVVLGSGFEDRPRLVDRIAERWPLAGCTGAAIAAVKHPETLAAACAELGIPHPPATRHVPATSAWLLRRRGASGGSHIRPAEAGPVPPHHFAQALVPGDPVSALILADGRGADVVAFSRQWADPAPDAPFRFAGVVGPIRLEPDLERAIAGAADRLAARFALRGLCSLDLAVGPDGWWLLEVNPRPGASLDALDHADIPLLSAHLRAYRGARPAVHVSHATIRATMVVYASSDSRVDAATTWPAWLMDRPEAGATIPAGYPIATVMAEDATAAGAERLARERARAVKRMLGETVDG